MTTVTEENKITILVTRPGEAGKALCAVLKAQGLEAIHCPAIAFAPPRDELALQKNLTKITKQDWIIFISPQAVRTGIALLRKYKLPWSDNTKIAAIGAGTAKVLQNEGYAVSACPQEDWSSEGLLTHPELADVNGKKIAIIRGEGGRQFLEARLLALGAQVIAIETYQRVLPTIEMAPLQKMMLANAINVIVCSSFEGVENLKKLFGQAVWPQLKTLPLIVVSERIKMLALDLGFSTIWVARNASHEAISQTLQTEGLLCQNNH